MPPLIRVPFNAFKEVERMLKYRWHDKERERSNRAAQLVELAKSTRRRCPMRHDQIAWSGPPHDQIRCYICLRCNAAASEPEIKDRGFDFDTIPDWEIMKILDLYLQRQAEMGNPSFYAGLGGFTDESDKP